MEITPVVGNPLLAEYERIRETGAIKSDPRDVWDLERAFTEHIGLMDECRRRWSFAIPNDAALDAIAKRGPVVEVGAGTGYWAALLAQRGVDVLAYDYRPPLNAGRPDACGPVQPENTYVEPVQYHKVIVCHPDGRVAHAYPTRTLLLVWPAIGRMAVNALRYYEQGGGERVAYVGEFGGCTGDEAFHARLRKAWFEVETVAIPTWPGMHDFLMVFERRG